MLEMQENYYFHSNIRMQRQEVRYRKVEEKKEIFSNTLLLSFDLLLIETFTSIPKHEQLYTYFFLKQENLLYIDNTNVCIHYLTFISSNLIPVEIILLYSIYQLGYKLLFEVNGLL